MMYAHHSPSPSSASAAASHAFPTPNAQHFGYPPLYPSRMLTAHWSPTGVFPHQHSMPMYPSQYPFQFGSSPEESARLSSTNLSYNNQTLQGRLNSIDCATCSGAGYSHSDTARQEPLDLRGKLGRSPPTPASWKSEGRVHKRRRIPRTTAARMNATLEELKKAIPCIPQNTKLSKLHTLQVATEYIRYLDHLLHATDPEKVDKFTFSFKRKQRKTSSFCPTSSLSFSASSASLTSSSPTSSLSLTSSPSPAEYQVAKETQPGRQKTETVNEES